MDWRTLNNVKSFSENVLLPYFEELSTKYKPTSLWSHFSILKSTLNLKNNVKIDNYSKVRAFLKRKSEGFQKKRAKTLTSDEINRFIKEAPDSIYLATKVKFL